MTTSRPFWLPATRRVSSFSTQPFLLLPLLCLTRDHSIYLPNTYSCNTCAPAITPLWKILKVSRIESEKNYSNATSIYIPDNYVLKYNLCSTRQFDTLFGLGSLGQFISIPCTLVLYADPKQCLYVSFAYCYKKNLSKKSSFSTPQMG